MYDIFIECRKDDDHLIILFAHAMKCTLRRQYVRTILTYNELETMNEKQRRLSKI